MGDLILQGEDVGQLAIVAFRPEMKTVCDLDQLRRDTDSAAGLSHTPFQDVIDIEPLADLRELDVLGTEEK